MSRRKVRRWAWMVVAVCLGYPPSSAALAEPELQVGYSTDILTLDPGDHRSRKTEVVLHHIFDGLITRGPAMDLHPEIAESWVRLSPTRYEFRLRDGVTFHDGRVLSADDVVYSFERLLDGQGLDGGGSPRRSLLGPLASVEATDRLTVRFELAEPWPIFPAMLPFQQIVSRPAGGDVARAASGPTGAGPYRLARWYPDDAIVLQRHEGYYGGATGRPPVGPGCVERIVFNVVPGNESRVAGLLAGDFHIVVDVPPHSVPVIERHAHTEALAVNSTRSFFIALNTQAPPFADARVRRAVAHGLDRDALIEEHLLGRATLIDGILSPDAFGRNPDLPRHAFDPARSRALLAEAGYAQGLDVKLDVVPDLYTLAESIAVQLASVGIRAEVVSGKAGELQRKWLGGESAERGDMRLSSWGNASLDPAGIFAPTHRSGGRGNLAGYSDAEMDDLLDAAAVEVDRDTRTALYRQAEAIANRDLPYIYLWVPQDIYGVSRRVRGFTPTPDGRLNLEDVCLDAGG